MTPPHHYASRSGRSDHTFLPAFATGLPSSVPTSNKPPLSVTTRNIATPSSSNAASPNSAGASASSTKPRSALRSNMTSHTYTYSSVLAPNNTSRSTQARLHKRGGSTSSAQNSPMIGTPQSQFAASFATVEDSFPDIDLQPNSTHSSTTKIKPHFRKRSMSKEDQGHLDLSKSYSDNGRLAGPGFEDLATARSVADVSFAHNSRKQPHVRNASAGSHMSTGSGSLRPGQTFTHPMKQTPRPYIPPTASHTTVLNHDEVNESDDVVTDEFSVVTAVKSRRSVSVSLSQQNHPMPLSRSHTASDLGLLPKLTNASTSNLSIKSTHSGKSKTSRSRRETEHSLDLARSPSSRTSLDRAITFMSRRSDTDPQQPPQSREELILAARRKFEAKEAHKDRKQEKEATKRREAHEARAVKRDGAGSSAVKQDSHDSSTSAGPLIKAVKARRKDSNTPAVAGAEQEMSEKIGSRSYEQYRPTNAASLPRHGREAGASEKAPSPKEPVFVHTTRKKDARRSQGGWQRFSTWVQTTVLSCGGA